LIFRPSLPPSKGFPVVKALLTLALSKYSTFGSDAADATLVQPARVPLSPLTATGADPKRRVPRTCVLHLLPVMPSPPVRALRAPLLPGPGERVGSRRARRTWSRCPTC